MFKYVRQMKQERLDESGSCVLMATPSMLQVPSLPHLFRDLNFAANGVLISNDPWNLSHLTNLCVNFLFRCGGPTL